ncbi:hypothetical protein [Helicobacter rodentium]|uniref:hypothetical protein n=1 Tax=Helicobacter rodentium TaxID=59617 RepID=UPI002352033B|nr:hypothetical protein [Helicobacter rodentium]
METGYKRASRKAVTILAESLGLGFYHTQKQGFFIYKDLSTTSQTRCKVLFKSKILRNIRGFLLELKKQKEHKARMAFIKENLERRNIALNKGQNAQSHFQPSFCF